MKKVALYSSSTRTRKAKPEDAPDLVAPPSVDPVVPPKASRAGNFYRRFEKPILVAAGALFAVALVLTYARTRPAAYEVTQKDIDAAVLHTLENTNLPSMATKAAAAIAPSVVRVTGYSPEKEDDPKADKGKDEDKGSADDKGKDSAKDAGKDKDKGKSAAKDKDKATAKDKAAAKDRLSRNDAGKDKPAEPGKDKDKTPGADKDADKDKQAERNGGFPGYRSTGVGTGVVIVDKGVILTNLHVVAGADKIKVRFFDGMEAEATIIGARPEHDLAVLQAKAIPDDLQAATLRSTADLQVGDQVVAVGFPFGIGPSASAGVVSGLKREYHSPEGKRILTNLIQFDAAANPGNSGGPLVTADGEVVGIVTGILNPTNQRVFIGIGFAVPIENAAAAVGMSPF